MGNHHHESRRGDDAPLSKARSQSVASTHIRKRKSGGLDYYNMTRGVNMEMMYNACKKMRERTGRRRVPSMRGESKWGEGVAECDERSRYCNLVPAAAEVELEPAREPAAAAAEALLEELRELRATGPAGERLPALLRHRVVRVLAVVEPCAELCGVEREGGSQRGVDGCGEGRTWIAEHLVGLVDRGHLRLAAALVGVRRTGGFPTTIVISIASTTEAENEGIRTTPS